MSEPMDFTSPTPGRIYARTSPALSIPEPGVQPQPSYPVIPPQVSTSVPPNLYLATRRLQPLISPSIISPTLSLPNILSPTPDNILHQHSIAPLAYRHLNNPHLHQPVPHGSPRLSYVTHNPILPSPHTAPVQHHHSLHPSPINTLMPHTPIHNLEQTRYAHSPAVSLRPPSVAIPAENFYPPQYELAEVPDAMILPLRMPSQAHSHQNVRPPSSVTESHHSHHTLLFHQTPPHINDYQLHQPNAQNNFSPPPLPNNYFVPPFIPHFAPPPFAPPAFNAPPPFPAPPPFAPPNFNAPNNFIPPNFNPPIQVPYAPPRRPPTLPPTKDIPKLTGKNDWGSWNTAVTNLIINQLVFGHILDDLDPGARYDPDLLPSLPPVIHPNSSAADREEFTHWWSMDGIASHILCSMINTAILNSLPMPNIRLGEHRTARDVYAFLCQHYGSGDYTSVANIETKLRAFRCGNGTDFVSVHDYISTY